MIKSFAIWLYDNADTVGSILKNTLEFALLITCLIACYGLLLLGGAS